VARDGASRLFVVTVFLDAAKNPVILRSACKTRLARRTGDATLAHYRIKCGEQALTALRPAGWSRTGRPVFNK
jgi:hypothetical protein